VRRAANVRGMEWVNVIGLACDLTGAAVLALGLFISEDEALKLGLPPYASDASDDPDPDQRRRKNLALPPVADRLRRIARRSEWGSSPWASSSRSWRTGPAEALVTTSGRKSHHIALGRSTSSNEKGPVSGAFRWSG
jgi:hypothetical protein